MQYPSDRFAACLAHYLNSEDLSSITVDEATLYDHLTVLLGTRYAEPLLHHPGFAARMSAEEAAERYFEATVMRPLQLSPRVQVSVSQKLLEALCRRAVEPLWADAAVARERAMRPPDETIPNVIPKSVQREFAHCSQRLAKLPNGVSPGSPSPTILARFGPVVLGLASLQSMVPEEISLWNAMACAPRTLKSLPAGKPFNEFCCLLIDAIRTAHRPYGELVGLGRGLCPFDWMEVLSIQQARSLRRFLRILSDQPGANSRSGWELAWQEAPVAGFKTAGDLWDSDIGSALREPRLRHAVNAEVLESLPDRDALSDEETLLDEDAFEDALEAMVLQGVIPVPGRPVLIALFNGKSKAEVLKLPGVKEHLNGHGISYEQFLEDLERRIQQWTDSKDKSKQ